MKTFWNRIFQLDRELSIWVEEEDLGKEKVICNKRESYSVKIPPVIEKEATLRLKGLGKKGLNKRGDLILHMSLNKGEDVRKCLWLSEGSARRGAEKRLMLDEKNVTLVIPPKSYHGLTIRIKGYGQLPSSSWNAPALHPIKRGNLLVKLFVYPDSIMPRYGSFIDLSTENMALEGWVYRKFDEVIGKLGQSTLPTHPLTACAIADFFNEGGWTRIFHALVNHLKLSHLRIELSKSATLVYPGICERTPITTNTTTAFENTLGQYTSTAPRTAIVPDRPPVGYTYKITIREQFLDNPFSVAAILAHELCHIVYFSEIDETSWSTRYETKSDKVTLEEERTVDLLVFMFRMGEFQLRVARDTRLTLGYFNQEIFERIQVIVSRKLDQC